MDVNGYLVFILVVIVGSYLLDVTVDLLNLSKLSPDLPQEFQDVYDEKKYQKSQAYLKTSTRFSLFQKTLMLPLIVGFILLGGFRWVDDLARSFELGELFTGLIFVGILFLMSRVLTLPFSIYETFVIEENFGFNRMKLKTFFGDLLKGLILTIILGGAVFAAIVWFFDSMGELAWVYAWLAITFFQIIIVFFAPVVIMPIFNKFTPLEDGELKQEIEKYAQSQNFFLQGIFKMDGSKRSSKSNAFFTGFGKYRRIVLFDTLIEKHSVKELVAVLAHEIGHYKMRHILKTIILSILLSGFMFYFISIFMHNDKLFGAFGLDQTSTYASLVFAAFLYSPISRLINVFSNALSRKHEFEADAFAAKTYGERDTLVSALKKLSVDNLSNLTPHPLKVVMDYTHPPVTERISAIRQ